MNKTNRAFKCRIYPNVEQQIMFSKTFGCCRFVYNKMLEKKISYYQETGENLSITPAALKKDFPFLREVDSLALANSQINLQAAYRNFFRDKKIGFPKFKKKSFAEKYTTNNQKGTIRIENGYIKLPKVGFVKIKLHRNIPNGWKIKSVTVSRSSSGKYYVSILFEFEHNIQPKELNENSPAVGLDFSMHDLFLSSDGQVANYPRFYRKSLDKLAKEQRKLSHCKKGSQNYHKQKRRVSLIHEKITNQRKDFLHKLSREITNLYDIVCIENLNMQGMSKSLNFGKSVHDNSWGTFIQMLQYKLEFTGKYLIKIDKWFASSQLCNICGYKNPDTKDLSVRQWTCPNCNTLHNRDINAAVNIKNEGLRLLKIQ
ncbi:MAG: RNA-guided endonuclease TnpB family protein [Candidatus Gastranaerophilaceae bacterium]